MKKLVRFELIGLLLLLIFLVITSKIQKNKTPEEDTAETVTAPKKELSENFKAYWYADTAEITSYHLKQTRYGELREGHAVFVYVTEPFLPEKQVKADHNTPNTIPVLKVNATKTFTTGIYPYTIMSSTFYPVYNNQHALKTSLSIQEWRGHLYAQINNRKQFKYTSHSYFENEADQGLTLEKNILENEIWTTIRIAPDDLPVGDLKVIPSLEYIHLQHITPGAYEAKGTLYTEHGIRTYTLTYPTLERSLTIHFSAEFPYTIERWTETFKSDLSPTAKVLSTTATKIKSLHTAYQARNRNEDVLLRDSSGL